MSTSLFNIMEYPGPALGLAGITIIVASLLIAMSLLVTLVASLLASLEAMAIRTSEQWRGSKVPTLKKSRSADSRSRCDGLAPGPTGE